MNIDTVREAIMKKLVKVVAAVIENENNEILCALRSPEMSIPNMWEFPGGKVESNEDIYSALKREIDEELDCKIETTKEIFNDNTHEYETFIINLISIKCKVVKGTPTPSEHSKLIWLKRENLDSLKWAPADIPAVEQLIQEK
jgi:8-oxo-dGTP diphosphatase